MSKTDIDRALVPFQQGNSDISRLREGTGLGLHLCQKLIKLHEGEITLMSEIDEGTTVIVSFPPERTVAA